MNMRPLYQRLLGRELMIDCLLGQLFEAHQQLLASRGETTRFAEWAGIHAALVAEIRRLRQIQRTPFVIRLAQAFGWGSAGQCPRASYLKTPAVRERVCRVAAAAEQGGVDLTRVSAPKPEPVGVSHA